MNFFQTDKIDWISHISKISSANRAISKYDGLIHSLPNPRVLLSPLVKKEALVSSKIEGTQASMRDVLEFEADLGNVQENIEDIKEVVNYRHAMSFAMKTISKKPLGLNLVKDVHSILLKDVRGQNKGRGIFRKEQVWIGPEGTSVNEAEYVPPKWEEVSDLMTKLEKSIYKDEKDLIVQSGIIHAQFELIHPFVDGNGRVGRILIPLVLYTKGVLSGPWFYISQYFESNREVYYEKLRNISKKGDWDGWIDFYLNAIISQSEENLQTVSKVLDLYNKTKSILSTSIRSTYGIETIDSLFNFPMFSTTKFVLDSKIPARTAFRILNKLEEVGLIKKIGEARGPVPAVYIFSELFNILR